MKRGWIRYFKLFSDYAITIIDIFEKCRTFAPIGTASAVHLNLDSLKETRWKVPAAWKAVVKSGLSANGMFFADNFETLMLVNGN